MRKTIYFIFWFWSAMGFAQDSVLVTKSFLFEDGLYTSLEALKANRPSQDWESIISSYFVNPRTNTTQVQQLIDIETGNIIDLDKIYALCIDGTPYVYVKEQPHEKMVTFAGLEARGILNYFSFEKLEEEQVKIQAYNPKNGLPFRTGFVKKDRVVKVEKILHWESGEVVDFSKENLMALIKNDQPLYKSVQELRDWELEEKLFRCLLIYNDRHDVHTLNPVKN